MLGFLANPTALAIVGLSLVAGIQTYRLAEAQKDNYEQKLAHSDYKLQEEKNARKVENDARDKSNQLTTDLVAEVKAIGIVASTQRAEIRLVQSNGGPCKDDPAYSVGISSARSMLEQAARGAAQGNPSKAGSGAPAAVRSPTPLGVARP